MIIGVPKEIKTHEYRVGMLPYCVQELVSRGHQVVVQSTAGDGVGISDNEYISAGAIIAATAEDVFVRAELIVKVKEPQLQECHLLKQHHILFTFLHLAADPKLALEVIKSGVTGIAYETVTDVNGRLPLLAPMSAVAGRIVVQMGARALEKPQGGRGVLFGGITGVEPAKVTILGGGVVGWHAIQVAMGMGANVTVLDYSAARLTELVTHFGSGLTAELSSAATIQHHMIASDLVVGAVLVPGAAAPKLVNHGIIRLMQPGSVVADVSIDQGGCFETSRATNFLTPSYVIDGVIHQCITNLPSAVPRTSAFALNNATLPYIIELAEKGYRKACLDNPSLLSGLNVGDGVVMHEFVAKAIDQEYVPALSKLII